MATPPVAGVVSLALAANGGVLTASSTYGAAYPPGGANDADRKGSRWGSGGGWNELTANAWPDWLQLDRGSVQSVAETNLFSIQDNCASPAEPTEDLTFSWCGLKRFEVQFWMRVERRHGRQLAGQRAG